MTQERAFLRAIVAEPDDDAHRLVYADWLDEHGQADRAAFIRGQIELSRLGEDSLHRRELAFRCRRLLEANEKKWLKRLQRSQPLEWRWSRGFVEMADILSGYLEEEGQHLFAAWPLRRLVCGALWGNIDSLALVPPDNTLTALDLIGNELDLRALKKLVRFRQFGGLRELGLMFNRLRDTAVDFLCGEPFFQRLSLIRLGANPFTRRGRERLREYFRERVTFARERDPERLYTFQDEYLRVGFGKGFTQLMMHPQFERVCVALFDHAGNFLGTETRSVPPPELEDLIERNARRVEVSDAWLEELGYQSATILVKRFRFDEDVGINDFNWWADAFDRPNHPQRAELLDPLQGWLEDGQFEFDFGRSNCWIARNGDVTDT